MKMTKNTLLLIAALALAGPAQAYQIHSLSASQHGHHHYRHHMHAGYMPYMQHRMSLPMQSYMTFYRQNNSGMYGNNFYRRLLSGNHHNRHAFMHKMFFKRRISAACGGMMNYRNCTSKGVPEPSIPALLGIGLLGIALTRLVWRRLADRT